MLSEGLNLRSRLVSQKDSRVWSLLQDLSYVGIFAAFLGDGGQVGVGDIFLVDAPLDQRARADLDVGLFDREEAGRLQISQTKDPNFYVMVLELLVHFYHGWSQRLCLFFGSDDRSRKRNSAYI